MRPGEKARKGLGAQIVLKLADDAILPKGTVIYADRYFMSPMLCIQVLRRSWHIVGTCQPNRKGFPKGVTLPAKGERGEIKTGYCTKTGVRALCWRDNKVVHMIATTGPLTTIQECKRRGVAKKGEKKTTITCQMPTIFADYNRGMGGVDLFDFLRNRYSIERIFRCNFWYKKLALGLLGMIATNAYIYWLSYNSHVKRDAHKRFFKELCASLLAESALAPIGADTDEPSSGSADHCLRKVTTGRPRCAWCTYNGERRVQTRVMCLTCEVGLCSPLKSDCSWLFHKSGLTPKDLRKNKPVGPKPAKRKRQRMVVESDLNESTTESDVADVDSD